MATPSSTRQGLVFGAEIELLIRPKSNLMPLMLANGWDKKVTVATKPNDKDPKKLKNRTALRTALAFVMTQAGVEAGLETKTYEDWTVTDERSLDELDGFWRVELVSRTITTAENWLREFDIVFRTVDDYCDVALTKGCSMHVHVSPALTGSNQLAYTMAEVKCILKAIAYFDEAITAIMPADRKANEYAQANVQSRDTPRRIKEQYQRVESHSWEPLFNTIDATKMKQQVQINICPGKFLSWNFMNLAQPCGTVEFRRPPGVRTAAKAAHWIAFTLAFIAQALRTDWRQMEGIWHYPNVDTLREFVGAGEYRLEAPSRGVLDLNRIYEDFSPPMVYSAAELEIIKRKKAEKAKTLSPFAIKASSRPNTPTSRESSPGVPSGSPRKSGKK